MQFLRNCSLNQLPATPLETTDNLESFCYVVAKMWQKSQKNKNDVKFFNNKWVHFYRSSVAMIFRDVLTKFGVNHFFFAL